MIHNHNLWPFGVALLALGCSGSAAQTRAESPERATEATDADSDNAESSSAQNSSAIAAGAQRTTRAKPGDVEQELVREARLDTILKIALARNPEVAEARDRYRSARERAPAASRLPDPVFEYQLWAQPFDHPYQLDKAQAHMFAVQQTFPAPGSLDARERAGKAQAEIAGELRRAREQDITARVRRTYAEYYRADREYKIRLEHVDLAQQVLELTRAGYQAGRGSQQDVLRAIVELSRVHNDLAAIERDRNATRGLLNALMARPASAPLGPPAALEPSRIEVRLDDLEKAVLAQSPDVAAAERALRASSSEIDAARASGRWPTFMVGLSYMYMPMEAEPHNYGAMFSISLPWLNPRYGEERRAAEAALSADENALSAARNTARYEVYDAVCRLQAAKQSFTIIDRDLLPQAQQSFESARAVYRGAQGDSLALLDALRSLLDVRLERERALARLESAVADLERAVGGPIPVTRKSGKRP